MKKMFDFIDKNIKNILLTCIGLIAVLLFVFISINSYKENTIDKEMIKRYAFCEGKVGIVSYNWVCNNYGECTKQYLHCDYFNYVNPEINMSEKLKYAYNNKEKIYIMNISTEGVFE